MTSTRDAHRWVDDIEVDDRLRRRWRAFEDGLPDPVRRFERWLRSPELVTTSASLAFYALVSLPPMLLIAFWVADVVLPEARLQDLVDQVSQRAPDDVPVAGVIQGLFRVGSQVGFVAVLAAAWPATTYGAALGRAFSAVTPGDQQRIRGWKGRLLSLVVVALLPLVVLAAVALLYVGPRFLGTGAAITVAMGVGALLTLWVVVTVVFALYRLRDASVTDVVVGAGLTTLLTALVSGGYLLYLRLGADFTQRYGASSLATLVLLGLWLLLGNAVLLVGYRLMLRRTTRRR